jgi:MFS transporter, DHA2 family, multidrug resistance protein
MPTSASEPAAPWRPAASPWIIAASVMLATFMEVLDTSVANVSLPHIAGSLAASTEESLWVLTSYLVANAIVLPAAGWLASTFGRKRLLMVCVTIFTVASLGAGAATSLGMIIVARVLQGLGGGALQPLAQAVLLESFPPAKRGAAMAVYGMGVVVAPIIGPTLGGWITDNYTWRWIFYINLPIGILAVLMIRAFVEDPPYIRSLAPRRIDYLGFGLLALWLGALQIALDKGQQDDWFASNLIRVLAGVAVLGLVAFIWRELTVDDPIVDLRIFRNRNFAVGVGLITVMGAVLYSSIALLPLFLQTVMNYPPLQSGLALSPRGIGALASMVIVGRLVSRLDTRYMIAAGFGILAFSTFLLSHINLDVAMRNITVPNIVAGFAMGFIFVPLTTTAMGTLRNEQIGGATGLYNLMRNIGGSVGIAVVTTLLARDSQAKHALLVGHLAPENPAFQDYLQGLQGALTPEVGAAAASDAAMAVLYQLLLRQVALLSYVDNFRLISIVCLACVPLVFLFRRVRARPGAVAAAH